MGGLVYNVRGMLDDHTVVHDFAESIGSHVIGHIPNTREIAEAEIAGKTVVEYAPESEIASMFRELALEIYGNTLTSVPQPLQPVQMTGLGQEIRKRTREQYTSPPSNHEP